MAQIKVLPQHLINQIAAGEVVERPASVVKELVENSLDALATGVTCEIVSGGLEVIIVTDNGSGIARKDAKTAWERHATSKISSQEDLFAIKTLGFRGEALASIASVSSVEMETKTDGEVSGTYLKITDGVIAEERDCGCPKGTKTSIFNLFYNTPARRKYIKSANVERKRIVEIIQDLALANPSVAFRLISDGKVMLDVTPNSITERIATVLGRDVLDNIVPVEVGAAGFKISGYVGKPNLSKSNRKSQWIVLNGRVIQNHLISYAVKSAYHSMLMNGKHPWFLLNMDVQPEDIDVNVHPRKLEVRFLRQNEIYEVVYKGVDMILNKNTLVPNVNFENPINNTGRSVPYGTTRLPRGIKEHIEIENRQDSFEVFQKGRLEEPKLKPIQQIANSYILAQDEEGVVIVDQHAAHERVMYEKLMKNLAEKSIASQPLLAPESVELSLQESEILNENMTSLEDVGFKLESFGGNTFLITAVPSDIAGKDIVAVLKGVIDDLAEGGKTDELSSRREHILHYTACRSAVKFGQKLSYEEQVGLLNQLSEIERKETCPHGRPTMIRITYDELEKRFKRKNF
ncbi:MAG: DNA mismatch repair endonuclease MutL [Candidatus Gracilibacteria bacterium]